MKELRNSKTCAKKVHTQKTVKAVGTELSSPARTDPRVTLRPLLSPVGVQWFSFGEVFRFAFLAHLLAGGFQGLEEMNTSWGLPCTVRLRSVWLSVMSSYSKAMLHLV